MGRVLHYGEATLKPGVNNTDVAEAQMILDAIGYQVEITGNYDPTTVDAVKAFQRDMNLAVDGIVGPATWAKLKEHQVIEMDPEIIEGSAPSSFALWPVLLIGAGILWLFS